MILHKYLLIYLNKPYENQAIQAYICNKNGEANKINNLIMRNKIF